MNPLVSNRIDEEHCGSPNRTPGFFKALDGPSAPVTAYKAKAVYNSISGQVVPPSKNSSSVNFGVAISRSTMNRPLSEIGTNHFKDVYSGPEAQGRLMGRVLAQAGHQKADARTSSALAQY